MLGSRYIMVHTDSLATFKAMEFTVSWGEGDSYQQPHTHTQMTNENL